MSVIRLKNPDISLDNLHPGIWSAIAIAAEVWAKWRTDLVITGANEPGHTTNPDPTRQFHRLPDGTCQAVDLRVWNLPAEVRREAVAALRERLGPDYDVIYERPGEAGAHVHVEYDKKV